MDESKPASVKSKASSKPSSRAKADSMIKSSDTSTTSSSSSSNSESDPELSEIESSITADLSMKIDFDNFNADEQVYILISQLNLQLKPYDKSISNIGPDLSDGIVLSILIDIHIPQFVNVVSEFPPARGKYLHV